MAQSPGPEGSRLRLHIELRTGAYVVVAVLGALAVLAVVGDARSMVTRVAIGILVALALDPLADALQRRLSLNRAIAVAILGLGVLSMAALLIVVLGPRAVTEAGNFSDQLPETLDEIETLPIIGDWARENDLGQKVQEWLRQLPEQLTDERVGEIAESLLSGVASIVIVSLVTLAVLIDGENLVNRFRRLMPPERRPQADRAGQVTYRTVGRYFGGSVTIAVLQGIWVLAIGFALGVPLTPVAAVWAMITNLIPQVGGFLGGSFFVLLASTQGAREAIIAGVLFVVYMNVENNLIQPAIVGKSVDLTAPTTMIAAFIGAAIAGIPGALVATPLFGATKAIYLEARGRPKPDPEAGFGFLDRIRNLFHRREHRRRKEDDPQEQDPKEQ